LSKKQKLRNFKMLWDTTGCTEWHRDLPEMAREDLAWRTWGYWDITEGVRDILGNKEIDCMGHGRLSRVIMGKTDR
jgi:hypothetical protein